MGRPQPVHQRTMTKTRTMGAKTNAANSTNGHMTNKGSQNLKFLDSFCKFTRRTDGGQIMMKAS